MKMLLGEVMIMDFMTILRINIIGKITVLG